MIIKCQILQVIIFLILQILFKYLNITYINIPIPRTTLVFNDDLSFGYISKSKNQRIFDVWMYNNEAEMAYIRMWRLYNYVDYFLITVSNNTFSGLSKNISFFPFDEDIKQFRDKMIIITVPSNYCKKNYMSMGRAWCIEKSQRDYSLEYYKTHMNPTENDILLVSDCDEIFTRDAIRFISEHPPISYYYVKGSMYFPYYFHYQQSWDLGFAIRYRKNMTEDLANVRTKSYKHSINYYVGGAKDFITHCSWCFNNIDQYINKLKSFSHQEFNKPPYTTPDFAFKSHYCRTKINSPKNHYDLNISDLHEYLPFDNRLAFLYDKSFEYDIKQTTFKTEDLKNLCSQTYDRSPFLSSL